MNNEMDPLLMNIHDMQSHLGIMIGTLVFTIIGLVFILVHASGQWLTTTVWSCVALLSINHLLMWQLLQPTNFPHQIFGIIAAAAVGINVRLILLYKQRSLSFVIAAIHSHTSLWPHQPMVHWQTQYTANRVINLLPSHCRRWVYNWTHGITGLILGQVAACNS